MADQDLLLPLFPLNVVLLPGMLLPLHIFEERYRLMIAECLERGSEFGVVYRKGDRVHDVGCAASIKRVLRRYGDGRMDILTVGGRVFRIVEVREDRLYTEARVDWIAEVGGEGQEAADLVPRASALLVEHSGLAGRPADMVALGRLSPSQLSCRMASDEGFPLDERQKILEAATPRRRLELAIAGFESLLERARHAAQVRRIVGGNGHLRGSLGR